jgi:hypothetical protein
MNLLLKYGGPKANFAFGLLFVFASIAGLAGLIQHFTWRGLTRGRSPRFGSNVVIADAPLNVLPIYAHTGLKSRG